MHELALVTDVIVTLILILDLKKKNKTKIHTQRKHFAINSTIIGRAKRKRIKIGNFDSYQFVNFSLSIISLELHFFVLIHTHTYTYTYTHNLSYVQTVHFRKHIRLHVELVSLGYQLSVSLFPIQRSNFPAKIDIVQTRGEGWYVVAKPSSRSQTRTIIANSAGFIALDVPGCRVPPFRVADYHGYFMVISLFA